MIIEAPVPNDMRLIPRWRVYATRAALGLLLLSAGLGHTIKDAGGGAIGTSRFVWKLTHNPAGTMKDVGENAAKDVGNDIKNLPSTLLGHDNKSCPP